MKDDGYRIEVFVFPDGTSVEMLVFDESAPVCGGGLRRLGCSPDSVPAASDALERSTPCRDGVHSPTRSEDDDAHECPVCGSCLVYPIDWDRSGEAAWTLRLRCPECESRREVVLGRASVERFNRELYRGAQAIAHEADRVTRRNFEEEVERIVIALERDLIQPMDF